MIAAAAQFHHGITPDLIGTIESEAQRLNRFVANLLDMARVEAGALDLRLPDRDGLSVISLLRARADLVILVVSARDAVDERVSALDLGAATAPKIVRRRDLSIGLDRRTVTRGAEELHVTRKEHDVLGVLSRYIGRVVMHERLLSACWGADEDARVEYLRVVVRNLRQNLKAPEPVGSVIADELGVGYRLRRSVMVNAPLCCGLIRRRRLR